MGTNDRLVLELPDHPTSSGRARAATIEFLGDTCAPALLDDVLIVVSELVANAVSHTGAGCTLTVHQRAGHIVVEVHDTDGRPSSRARRDESLGRGLGMVQTVTQRWGIERLAKGKCVWAEIAR